MSREITETEGKKVLVDRATREVRANFEYFRSILPELMKNHYKEFALLHDKGVIAFFESENDAIKTGKRDYGPGGFSVQQVVDARIDLGYQSHLIL